MLARCLDTAVLAYQKYRLCHGNKLVVKNGSPTRTEILANKGRDKKHYHKEQQLQQQHRLFITSLDDNAIQQAQTPR